MLCEQSPQFLHVITSLVKITIPTLLQVFNVLSILGLYDSIFKFTFRRYDIYCTTCGLYTRLKLNYLLLWNKFSLPLVIIVTSDHKLQLLVGHCNELELAMMSLALLFDSIHYLNTVIANVVNNIKLPELQVTTWTENLLLLLPATWNLFLLNLRFISTLIK